MTQDQRRITLIARDARSAARDWDESNPNQRIIFIDAFQFLQYAVERAVQEAAEDLARVIIDRVGTPLQFLDVLSKLPVEFVGDVLFILENGSAYLSSIGRGGDRVLYALNEHDVEFYLHTNSLVWPEGTPAVRISAAAIAQSA
ncbi:MAG TPA: hypothetical protein VL284_15855 [Thermoanaerobaculia bacterium]|nr:hypothetical protein [Thermoanaerobaculia bacterium]